jgi:hypothetical protein
VNTQTAAHASSPWAGQPMAIDQLSVRHLTSAPEIEKILHLREEIDLSAHSPAGPAFRELEKKETSAGSSVRSNSKVKS